MKIAVLAGDGIGPEIVAEATKVLRVLAKDGLKIEMEDAAFGGAGFDACGDPLPAASLKLAKEADAVLCGAVGGPKYDALPRPQRPERGDRCASGAPAPVRRDGLVDDVFGVLDEPEFGRRGFGPPAHVGIEPIDIGKRIAQPAPRITKAPAAQDRTSHRSHWRHPPSIAARARPQRQGISSSHVPMGRSALDSRK